MCWCEAQSNRSEARPSLELAATIARTEAMKASEVGRDFEEMGIEQGIRARRWRRSDDVRSPCNRGSWWDSKRC